MKLYNKFMVGTMACLSLAAATSCSEEFLDEDAGHMVTDKLLETPEGAQALAASLYGNIRWHFGYEWA